MCDLYLMTLYLEEEFGLHEKSLELEEATFP